MMEPTCMNCKFYEPYPRKLRYPRGHCKKQFAYRVSDGYKLHLSIITPYEYRCDFHEPAPQPVYVTDGAETFLIPPIVAQDLIAQGWVFVKIETKDDKLVISKAADEAEST